MAGSLLPEFVFRALDANGLAMGGAQLFFYQTGTLTPQSVFTTSAVSVAAAACTSSSLAALAIAVISMTGLRVGPANFLIPLL